MTEKDYDFGHLFDAMRCSEEENISKRMTKIDNVETKFI